jgi:hypothetical protein
MNNFIESKVEQNTLLFLGTIGSGNYNLINENILNKTINNNGEI